MTRIPPPPAPVKPHRELIRIQSNTRSGLRDRSEFVAKNAPPLDPCGPRRWFVLGSSDIVRFAHDLNTNVERVLVFLLKGGCRVDDQLNVWDPHTAQALMEEGIFE
jgi:hypothetical protein